MPSATVLTRHKRPRISIPPADLPPLPVSTITTWPSAHRPTGCLNSSRPWASATGGAGAKRRELAVRDVVRTGKITTTPSASLPPSSRTRPPGAASRAPCSTCARRGRNSRGGHDQELPRLLAAHRPERTQGFEGPGVDLLKLWAEPPERFCECPRHRVSGRSTNGGGSTPRAAGGTSLEPSRGVNEGPRRLWRGWHSGRRW